MSWGGPPIVTIETTMSFEAVVFAKKELAAEINWGRYDDMLLEMSTMNR
jgi:hypothetical protein